MGFKDFLTPSLILKRRSVVTASVFTTVWEVVLGLVDGLHSFSVVFYRVHESVIRCDSTTFLRTATSQLRRLSLYL